MATIKSYTDLEQSKKLAKILPLESSDMRYKEYTSSLDYSSKHCDVPSVGHPFSKDIPCWSLAALLGILPILERKGYQKAKPRLLYNVDIDKWIVDSHVYTTDTYDNPVDACCEMIIRLYGIKML